MYKVDVSHSSVGAEVGPLLVIALSDHGSLESVGLIPPERIHDDHKIIARQNK